jgi:hypothetical protein
MIEKLWCDPEGEVREECWEDNEWLYETLKWVFLFLHQIILHVTHNEVVTRNERRLEILY